MVFAALAGIYSIATTDPFSARLAFVMMAPALEAALPLVCASLRARHLHSARVIATLLVVFYVVFAPIGIDNYLYLPAAVALIAVMVMSNRARWREIREGTRAGR